MRQAGSLFQSSFLLWRDYRRAHVELLMASVAASRGEFEEAERSITKLLAHPLIAGPGRRQASIRADLRARQQSYRSHRVYASPESQVLWRIPSEAI